jgi:hypothetical protein
MKIINYGPSMHNQNPVGVVYNVTEAEGKRLLLEFADSACFNFSIPVEIVGADGEHLTENTENVKRGPGRPRVKK